MASIGGRILSSSGRESNSKLQDKKNKLGKLDTLQIGDVKKSTDKYISPMIKPNKDGLDAAKVATPDEERKERQGVAYNRGSGKKDFGERSPENDTLSTDNL
jgi:hypothetical protein